MKQFVGLTSSAMYFKKITNISIDIKECEIKVYCVPFKPLCDPESVDTTKLKCVWSNKFSNESLKTKYDSSGYVNGNCEANENFKLLINDVVIHNSQYVEKYLIEFNGTYDTFVLAVSQFVDH